LPDDELPQDDATAVLICHVLSSVQPFVVEKSSEKYVVPHAVGVVQVLPEHVRPLQHCELVEQNEPEGRHGVAHWPLWQVRPLQHWLLVEHPEPEGRHGVAHWPLWQVRPLQHWLLVEHPEPEGRHGVAHEPLWQVSPVQHWPLVEQLAPEVPHGT
jgi:hypothetical protein